ACGSCELAAARNTQPRARRDRAPGVCPLRQEDGGRRQARSAALRLDNSNAGERQPTSTKGVAGAKLGATIAPLPPPDQRPAGFPDHGVLVTDVVSLGT